MTAGPEAPLGALLAEPGAASILRLLNGDGAETRIVGGAVRNALIGAPVSDIDLATTLTPDAVTRRAEAAGFKVAPTGVAHGTVTVVAAGRGHEVTTLRRDVATDGRRAVVAFTTSFEEDALRRDFTINQLSVSADGVLHDYAGGVSDLAARHVRFIGDADRRIAEDYLRILRFFRFSAEYGAGPLDAIGLEACRRGVPGLAQLSRERVWSELKKLLATSSPALKAFVEGSFFAAVTGGTGALEALAAADAVWPRADALTRLAVLAVRGESDVARLDERLRLSAAERRRLEQAEGARAFLAASAVDHKRFRGAAFRHGAEGAQDGLLMTAPGGDAAVLQGWLAEKAPLSPFRGADVVALGVRQGPRVGEAIRLADEAWEARGFPEDAAGLQEILREAAARADDRAAG